MNRTANPQPIVHSRTVNTRGETPAQQLAMRFSLYPKLEVLSEQGVRGAHFSFRWDGKRGRRTFDDAKNRYFERGAILAVPPEAA
ncbi:MAG: hypothetical protein EOS07_07530 [Mesorhizobium sp.]|uniref:hypothetical protein n=1 Tax=Mesorhizobium sp. TaxID=1871066 RepID=UPI000FE387B3|nr:hypothetical protein [Mesorhizobium sp.]RWO10997.1 MAG: hypothetical protein EOS07_07530 [Mesorhizobium sp.]RWP07913.1 MAG: hypothetical protein EOQ99_04140 [Mesorhizobium sp.]RWQ22691.1 MAG: hypothetical protein EOR92_06645 [Mesorhizobium sp.]RWQ55222.1 MAG: hypothetical protein EOS84_11710 [Mesorhizobium sp.]RWQ61590.1 MAG: hypothetical protein EOS83_00500 [Mesorhizobium sp.]